MSEGSVSPGKLSVFVSYSRDDLGFADQLVAALELHGFTTTLDRQGISGGEDWRRKLGNMIRDADTVVFVLSPASASSEICAWEVEEATRVGKRVIPVLCRPIDGAKPPPQLAELEYIFFYDEPAAPGSGFGTGQVRLVAALNTDLEWLREHTRLLQRATEWDAGARRANRLLSGADIELAKLWIARQPHSAPPPTSLQLDYIRASEEEEQARAAAIRQNIEERERLVRERETAAQQAQQQARKAEEAARATEDATSRLSAALKREADEQRKRYRVRNIAFALSVVAALIAGSAYAFVRFTEAERQRERAESIVNQSRYVAERARRFIDNGDAGTALNLLLENLEPDPEDPGPMPEVIETHMALFTGMHANFEREIMQVQAPADIVANASNGTSLVAADRSVFLYGQGHSEPRQRLVHGGKINAAAFNRAGTHVLTAAQDRKARLWDLATGTAKEFVHETEVLAAVLDPKETLIATAAGDSKLAIWGIASGQRMLTMAHESAVVGMSWAQEGQRLYTATSGGLVRAWQLPAGTELFKVEVATGVTLTGMSINPDGTRIVTAGVGSGAAALLDATDGRRLADLSHGRVSASRRGRSRVAVTAAVFSPADNLVVTTGSDLRSLMWDADRGTMIYSLLDHSADVSGAAFSPDGSRLLTYSRDRTARVYAACDGRELAVLRGHTGDILSAHFDSDGCNVLTGSRDSTARTWDLARRHGQVVIGEQRCTPGFARQTSEPCRAQREFSEKRRALLNATISQDGKWVATAGVDGGTRIYDAETGDRAVELPAQAQAIRAVAFDGSGRLLATGQGRGEAEAREAGVLRIWDWRARREIVANGVPHADAVRSVSFSPDNSRILTASGDGLAHVFDAASGKLLLRIETQADCGQRRCLLYGASWSPNGERIATASTGKRACIWPALSASPVVTEPTRCFSHDAVVYSAKWSSDGSQVVTASGDKTAVVWDVENGNADVRLHGEDFDFRSADFLGDDEQIVTRNSDYAVRFWMIDTGHEAAKITHRQAFLTSASMDKSGERLLTAAIDGTARKWELPPTLGDAAQRARARLARCLSEQQRLENNLARRPQPKWCAGKLHGVAAPATVARQ